MCRELKMKVVRFIHLEFVKYTYIPGKHWDLPYLEKLDDPESHKEHDAYINGLSSLVTMWNQNMDISRRYAKDIFLINLIFFLNYYLI